MILLTVEGLRKYYGAEPVLDGVTFDVRRGERIALVGPNGAGKTTLMRILTGSEEAEAGTAESPSDLRLGYLEQQPDFAPGQTIRETARQAMGDLLRLVDESEEVAEQLAAATDGQQRQKLGERFERLQHAMHQRQAYQVENKIEKILTGLGFPSEQFDQPVEQLSGGQQNRLMLAALLLEEPDLLLLDEPSNHLDVAATQWLEDYLVDASPTLILVSHDRYFLDRVSTRTLELFDGTVDSYRGNYSAYVRQKAERLEVQRRTYEKQQTEIEKMEDFVRKHHHGQKHAQAEDRRKKLERIERVAPPRAIASPPMGFPPASRTGDIVLRTENLSKGFGAEPLFRQASFDILRGEKWGILGPNGSGKTTLLKCLLGELTLDEGQVTLGAGVQVGYFDQLLRCLADDVEVVDAIRPSHKDFVEQQRRDVLAKFGITGDMVFQRVHSLSGGERNRVALAMLAASDANFLILDEPTNHLDLWARESLERSLLAFEGTVLFVSHDRYFLNQVADHLLVVEPPRLRVIEGNYDTYRHFVKEGLAEGQQDLAGLGSTAGNRNGNSNKADGKAAGAARANDKSTKRKRKFPYRKVTDLEQDIAQHEERLESLQYKLASPEVLRDGEKVKQCKSEFDTCQSELERLYEHWEEAMELNG